MSWARSWADEPIGYGSAPTLVDVASTLIK